MNFEGQRRPLAPGWLNNCFPVLLPVLFLLAGCSGGPEQNNQDVTQKAGFDWQGHRGARGLLPENSVLAFLKALEYPEVSTLELDVVISRDSQVIVSHEPWMSAGICSHPDGSPVREEEEKGLNIFQLTTTEIRSFDCGSRGHERFPEQKAMTVHKPRLEEVVLAVNRWLDEHPRPAPRYNIEIKSQAGWDNVFTPEPETFARLLLAEINRLGIRELTCVQSFDVRSLQAIHQLDSTLTTAFLIETADSVAQNLRSLGYVPDVYSPYYMMVTANLVEVVHQHGMRIIPWTVNDTTAMISLVGLGVDGIITDYPDRIGALKGIK